MYGTARRRTGGARVATLAALFTLAALSACGVQSTNPVTGEDVRGAYSWDQELALGREADPELRATFGVYDDPQLARYVTQIGERVLAASSHADAATPAAIRDTPFHFAVLDSPVPNAMALPGGYIYVTRGLLAHLRNEAQLSVVLGHEIGHVLARHASRQALKTQTGQLGVIGAAILGGVLGGGRVGQGILDYGGTGAQLLFLKYGRDAEREADLAGVEWAEAAGYDAAPAADFFAALERLGEREGGIPSFLSTHPDPAERRRTIPELAARHDGGTAVNEVAYLERIEGLVLGDDPRQGFVEAGAFLHPELRFRFRVPAGWNTMNGTRAVQLAHPQGAAMATLTFARQQGSPRAAAQAWLAGSRLRLHREQAGRVPAGPAHTLLASGQSEQGEVAVLAYFIAYGERVYRFSAAARPQDYEQLAPEFERMLQSFAPLTERRHLVRQPARLEVVRLGRAADLDALLADRPMPAGMDATQIAIMNNISQPETLPAGTRLKLPRR